MLRLPVAMRKAMRMAMGAVALLLVAPNVVAGAVVVALVLRLDRLSRMNSSACAGAFRVRPPATIDES